MAASSSSHYPITETQSSFEESSMGQMALEKAHELFDTCDVEKKGFIIKRDMQRLHDDLPGLTPDQLEEVFDSLDQENNGFLTSEEFVRGFGAFLGLQIPEDGPTADSASLADELQQANQPLESVEQEHFQDIMDTIGAADVFVNSDAVKKLWTKLRHDDPDLLDNFESFLSNVSSELKRSKEDFSTLESALQQRGQSHDVEVNKLYDEMEQQIRVEKERILEQEKQKAQKVREDMEKELLDKDQHLQEIIRKHNELEKKYSKIATTHTLTEQENEELQKERHTFEKEKDLMESDLEQLRRAHEEAREQLENIKRQTKEEKKRRAKESFKVTEGIAHERESLVKQLDDLRVMNQRLKDERDEFRSHAQKSSDEAIEHKPSIIGPYLRGLPSQESGGGMPLIRGEVEVDDKYIPGSLSDYDRHADGPVYHPLMDASAYTRNGGAALGGGSLAAELAELETRRPPLGGNEVHDFSERRESAGTPDRIFKVVFVGDSGVGKTCFLHRFCHNRFKPSFNATIGVDFTVKTINLGERLVALQLWDTAGQERFRSITKQYFRKADGVVLMYDVTSEQSFLNLRNWMGSVKDGVDDNCVLCIVGNKVDLYENDESRVVKYKHGERLAEDCKALFFETSASSGRGITECMRAVAIHLQEREDQHLEDALKLELEVQRKRKCCSKGD
uniref:EF-hand domain-containing protein n=1 Tax=Plectus sambesii TaxID=2011161 RepID=A0A914X1U8_9BILA